MVYDLKQNNFNALGGINLNIDDIKSVIEFGQLGGGEIFLHTNGEDDMINRLQKTLNVPNSGVLNGSVPPTSVQSFLEAKPDLTTVVISNHKEKFKNHYYNGILDDAESLGFNRYYYSSCLKFLCIFHVFCIEILIMYHVLATIVAHLHQI